VPPRIRFCRSADGARVAFATAGEGPPLVQTPTWLTHLELDWTSAAWRPWIDELAARHTLVRHDLRGCGLSDRTPADPARSLEAWVADLEAVVDALALERFPLLGLCQGGAIAAAFAARHPERVSRLVLYGSYVQGALARDDASKEAGEALALAQLIESGWGRSTPAFREVFACMLMPAASPEVARSLAEMERECATPETAARLWVAFHRLDIAESARRLSCPTLVLHARGDGMVPFAEGQRLATLVPEARFVPLESRNHILQQAEPAWTRFWSEVHDFLGEEVEAPRPSTWAGLTVRERGVLDQIARGRSNDEIAEDLGIRAKTVRNHITSIFRKLGVTRRSEAIVRGREAGLGRHS
jgi:pimeloyl-ACP methyl ester carboxylesterase/DNA-binding CsgD family transcriptional regulator